MRSVLLMILAMVFILNSCKSNRNQEEIFFFERGSLSKNNETDSVGRSYYAGLLKEMKEEPLNSIRPDVEIYRLVVTCSFYNSYVIRVMRFNDTTQVIFKLAGDKGLERSALSSLILNYSSGSKRMDSLYSTLLTKINRYDFHHALDDTVAYVVADGISCLLESRHKGNYQVVTGIMSDAPFVGSEELNAVVESMHRFVPRDFIPDFDSARTVDDIVFPVLRKSEK